MSDDRIFNWYKNDLLKLAAQNNNTLRYICIEYITSFPKINPVVMAGNLMRDNIDIVFDDSTKSRAENERLLRKVKKWYAESCQ